MPKAHGLLILSVFFCSLFAFSSSRAEEPVGDDMGSVGIISSMNGEARITRSENPQQANQPKYRGPIVYGDSISTAKDSTVGLLMAQKSLLTMQELSDVRIAEAANNRQTFEMVRGKVCLAVGQPESSATEPLRLQTPTAIVTAAPGTLLSVEVTSPPKQSRLSSGMGGGERAIRISSTQAADSTAAPVVETYQVIEGSIDIVSLASSSSRTSVRSGQNVRIAGGVIGRPFDGPQVNCRTQNTQILPPHTITPKAAQQVIVQEVRKTATTNSVAAMSQASGGHGSSPPMPSGVYLATTPLTLNFNTTTSHSTISVKLP